MEQCRNKVGMALRTSRKTCLGPVPDSECPKFDQKIDHKWSKYAENSLLAKKIGPEGLFLVERSGTRLEHKRGKPEGQGGALFLG